MKTQFYIYKEGTTKSVVAITSDDPEYPVDAKIKFYESLGYHVSKNKDTLNQYVNKK